LIEAKVAILHNSATSGGLLEKSPTNKLSRPPAGG